MIRTKIYLFSILTAAFVLNGCIKVVARGDAVLLSEIRNDQVMVVGKIELIPPLQPDEQRLGSRLKSSLKDNALVLIDDQKFSINDPPRGTARAGSLVKLGQTFYLIVDGDKNRISYFSGGMIVVDDYYLTTNRHFGYRKFGLLGFDAVSKTDHFKLPGGIQFNTDKSMRAVYIGTIQYHRDEFNAITKIQVTDEYAGARQGFIEKYGTKTQLHKIRLANWKKS